jgi:hypothetical protein
VSNIAVVQGAIGSVIVLLLWQYCRVLRTAPPEGV